jgi:hypothetical protein
MSAEDQRGRPGKLNLRKEFSMRANHQDCFYYRDDLLGSWGRLVKWAENPTKTFICVDPDNESSEVKAVFCLSVGHKDLPDECETKGKTLLSLMCNKSRNFLAVAVERVPSPATLIPSDKRRFIKILQPTHLGFFSNTPAIHVDETPLNITLDSARSVQIETRVLRDQSLGHVKIAELERADDWTLAGRTDVSRSTVEAL